MAPRRKSQRQKRLEHEAATEEKIVQACAALKDGSCKKLSVAAKQFEVPYHTLRRRYLKLTVPRSRAHENQQLLTHAQEETMCHWIHYMALTGHPLSRRNLRMKAGELSDKLRENAKKSGTVPMASRKWLDDFLARHPDIDTKRPTGLDPKRAQMFNFTVVNHHFQLLDDFLKAHGIPWENVYNMDEKGIQLGGGRKGDNTKYLYARSAKIRVKIQSASLELVTVIECVSADGSSLQPGIVFSGKDVLREEYFEEEDILVALSPKGWTSDFIGSQWFEKSFIPQASARNTSGKPILLIYDGHKSHETIALREAAERHNIHLFCLPPHTTHRLQPLDVGCFGPLQRAWQKRCATVMEETGEGISKKNFVHEYMIAREEAFKEETIRKAWKNTGINPLNPGIFTEDDYAPSYNTSTELHLPETYPADELPSAIIDMSSDDPTYEPGTASETESDDSSDMAYYSEEDQENSTTETGIPPSNLKSPIPLASRPPASFQDPLQNESLLGPSSSHIQSLATGSTATYFLGHRKTRSQSKVILSRSATPVSRSVTPRPSSSAETLRMEERISELEEEVRILRGMKEAAETHCYFSGQMITHLQKRLDTKEGDKGKRQRAPKTNVSARVLTSAEGREELRQLREHEEQKKQKEAEIKAKKAAEEQVRRERRADPARTFTGTLSKSKKKEELEDLAAALALPESGKKEDIFARITEHFEKYPQLKLEDRFKNLFFSQPTVRSRKRPRTDDEGNAANAHAGPLQNRQRISMDVSMDHPSDHLTHAHAPLSIPSFAGSAHAGPSRNINANLPMGQMMPLYHVFDSHPTTIQMPQFHSHSR